MNNRVINTSSGGSVLAENYLFSGIDTNSVRIEDVSNTSSVSLVASFSIQTGIVDITDIAIDSTNSVAYITDIEVDKLFAIDISDPNNMSLLGELEFSTPTYIELDVANSVAYVTADLTRDVYSIDISNPASMSILDILNDAVLDDVRGISLDLTNDRAYVVTDTTDSIVAIDISNPSSLSILGSLNIAVQIPLPEYIVTNSTGTVAIVGGRTGNYATFDISNPASMSVINSVSTSGDAIDDLAIINDSYVILGVDDTQPVIRTVAISDLSTADSLTRVDSNSRDIENIYGIVVDATGNYAYVTTLQEAGGGISKISISNPTNIREIDYNQNNLISGRLALDTINEYAFVASGTLSGQYAITSWGISSSITVGSTFSEPVISTLRDIKVDINTSTLYVYGTASSIDGWQLQAWDVTNISTPTLIGSYDESNADIRGGEIALDIVNGYCYVVDSDDTFSININNPSNMTLADVNGQGGNYIALDLTNQVAYVVNGNNIHSLDISNPDNIVTLQDTFELSPGITGIVLDPSGGWAYVSCDDSTRAIISINISNPASLSIGDQSTVGLTADRPYDIALDAINDRAYLVDTITDSITSINISSPTSLIQDSTLDLGTLSGHKIAIDISRGLVFIADNDIIDISNPSAMSDIGNLNGYRDMIALSIPGPASTGAYS